MPSNNIVVFKILHFYVEKKIKINKQIRIKLVQENLFP